LFDVWSSFEEGALLAQWLERAAVNRKVTGSIPVGSVVVHNERVDGDPADRCHSGHQRVYSSAVERLTADQQVPGSNPGVPFCRVAGNVSMSHYDCSRKSLAFVKQSDSRQDVGSSGVAQWLACWAHNSKVGGSKPLSASFARVIAAKTGSPGVSSPRWGAAAWPSGLRRQL
jgi:hypothetical protein